MTHRALKEGKGVRGVGDSIAVGVGGMRDSRGVGATGGVEGCALDRQGAVHWGYAGRIHL